MFTDRFITIAGFALMLFGLLILGYQNVKIAHIAAELHGITVEVLKRH